MNFLKEDPDLMTVLLANVAIATPPPQAIGLHSAACGVAARLGGLLQLLAAKMGIEMAAVIAVWLVESSGLPFVSKGSRIRVEVHQLFDAWGRRNRQQFDSHFRFGGHNLQLGQPWQNHEFRAEEDGKFHSVHHNQRSEHAALTLAQILAGAEDGFRCTSIGGCQIMMNSFELLGYRNAQEMYVAFQQSERAQVLGFLDFCRNKPSPRPGDLLNYLGTGDWANFAEHYKGPGQVPAYAAKLQSAYEACAAALPVKDTVS